MQCFALSNLTVDNNTAKLSLAANLCDDSDDVSSSTSDDERVRGCIEETWEVSWIVRFWGLIWLSGMK